MNCGYILKNCLEKLLFLLFLTLFIVGCSNNEIDEVIELNSNQTVVQSSKTTNLALGKTAEQSSTGYGGVPSRAVDGNTSGVWKQNSVTHTNKEYQPWWQVRLGEDYEIDQVVIWNRTNCCMDRLSNFDVFIYNAAGSQVFKTTIAETPNPSVSINTGGVVGARVRVKLKGDQDPLSLAEVQVFGNEVSSDVTTVNWENWYLSVPVDRADGSGKATSIYYEDIEALNLTSAEKVFFDQNSDGSYKMNTRYTGYTTSGQYGLDEAKYCRTELREYWQGNQSTSDNWSMESGTHIMESTLKVESIGGDGRTYVGQIHGYPTEDLSKSPATIKVQWNNGDIVLEYYTADGVVDGEWTVANDVATTVAEVGYEKFTIKIKIEDGKLFLAVICDNKDVNTGYIEYYDYVGNGYAYDNYFKTGNYFKWNDDYAETSEVTLYGVATYHY